MRYLAIVRAKRGNRNHIPQQFSELLAGTVTVESEYWLRDSTTCAVVVFTTNDPARMTAALDGIQALFSITLMPVISVDEGLRLLEQVANEPLMVFG